MNLMLKCAHCRQSFPPDKVLVNSRYKTKSGKETISYYCLKCVRERRRRYYDTSEGRVIVKQNIAVSYLRHREKYLARMKVFYRLKTGDLIRPDRCSNCQRISKVQAHHENYERPLDVIWLCTDCHKKLRHKKC